MQWPISPVDRILLSAGIFLMITAWGGLLMARSWALPLEILRQLYQAAAVVFVLDRSGIAPWTGWHVVAIALWTGLGLLYISFQVRRYRAAMDAQGAV